MDGSEIINSVKNEKTSALNRLNSGKLLISLTNADLTTESVLAALATYQYSGRAVFEQWRNDTYNEQLEAVFTDVTAGVDQHYTQTVAELQDWESPCRIDPIRAYLSNQTEDLQRLSAGLVGWPLVMNAVYTQVTSFFINEADERRSAMVRSMKAETLGIIDSGTRLLSELCKTPKDWQLAQEAATDLIDVAYSEYSSNLEQMGLDPKPIC